MRTFLATLLSLLLLVAQGGLAEAASPIVKGPYLQGLGPSSVVVRVEMDPPAAVDVEVSLAGGKLEAPTVVHDEVATFHSVRVQGLKSSSRYVYRVKAQGTQSPDGTFTTAPSPESGTVAPFTFLVYGDDRSGDEAHATLVRAMLGVPSDFLVNTGDFVEDGSSPAEWQTFFGIEAPLLRDRCVFVCVGNHELVEQGGVSFLRYFGPSRGPEGKLYQSLRWGNTRFFLLNGMDTWTTGAEKDWLRDELVRADTEVGIAWRVVVVHFGPWSSGPHGKNERLLDARLIPLLSEHKVSLVLSGHDHIYERGQQDGLRYVVSGGGGAPLYRLGPRLPGTRRAEAAYHYLAVTIAPDAVKMTATRIDGSVIERCGFTASGADWDCDPAAPTRSTATAVASEPEKEAGASSAPPRCGCRAVGAASSGFAPFAAILGLVVAAGRRRRDPS